MSKYHPGDGQQEELQDAQPGEQSTAGEGAMDELGIESQEPIDEEHAMLEAEEDKYPSV